MRLAGPAFTIEVRAGDNLMIHAAIAMAQPGDILVVDGKGDRSCALMGSIMMTACKKLGLGGVVLDGSHRDTEETPRARFSGLLRRRQSQWPDQGRSRPDQLADLLRRRRVASWRSRGRRRRRRGGRRAREGAALLSRREESRGRARADRRHRRRQEPHAEMARRRAARRRAAEGRRDPLTGVSSGNNDQKGTAMGNLLEEDEGSAAR